MAVANRVEEPVQCRNERALSEGVTVDDIDPGLDADDVCRDVADRPRHDLVEHALTGEREVLEVDARKPGGDRWPRRRRLCRFEAVADRAAAVDPRSARARRGR